MSSRLIPVLTLRAGGLCKTIKFSSDQYLGDPINALRIFNEKEADELILLDIGSPKDGTGIDYELLQDVVDEAFMPICYGGGVTSIEDCERLFSLGIEKVSLNSSALTSPDLVRCVADRFGSQSVVVSIDFRRRRPAGHGVYGKSGTRRSEVNLVQWAQQVERLGAGEIVLTSIDQEGTRSGYDLRAVAEVADAVGIPVVALGGAGSLADCGDVIRAGASGAAASTLFLLHGERRGLLISYPAHDDRLGLLPPSDR